MKAAGRIGGLIERRAELARIDLATESLAPGRGGGIMLFAGAPGIGKSTLLTQAQGFAAERGHLVLSARAEALERDIPYSLCRELFGRAVIEADLPVAFRGPAGLARGLFEPGFLDADRPAKQGGDLTHALYWLLVNLAELRPAVLVVDDVHDADRSSLGVLAYIAGRLDQVDVLLVAAGRSATSPGPELAALFDRAERAGSLVEPGMLSREGVAAMLEGELGDAPAGETVDSCFSATDGNPELVRELASELRVSGSPVPAIAPGAISKVAVRRLHLLGDREREVAEAISVLGGQSTVDRIVALVRWERTEVEAAVARLELAGLAGRSLPPALAHPTIAASVAEQMPAAHLSDLHARASELLAAEGIAAPIQAAHLLHVEPSGSRARAETLLDAAGWVVGDSPETAVRFLERARLEPAPPDLMPALLRDLGVALLEAGDDSGLARLRESIDLASGPEERARTALVLGGHLTTRSRWQEAAELLTSARDALVVPDPELELELDASSLIAAWAGGERAGRNERMARIESQLGAGVEQARSRALSTLAWIAATEATDAERVRRLALEAIAIDTGDADAELLPRILVIGSLVAVDVHDEALAAEEDLLEQSAGEPEKVLAYAISAGMAMTHLWRIGDLKRAIELGSAVRLVAPPALVPVVGPLAVALADAGRTDDAHELCEEAGIEGRSGQPGLGDELVQFALARVLRWEGRSAEAAAAFERAGSIQLGHGIAGTNLIAWRSQAALCALRSGDRVRALLLAREEAELAREYGAAGSIGIALAALGTVEGGEEGRALLEESLEALGRAGLELELAAAHYELGGVIRREGRQRDAREPLRRALEIAVARGAKPLEAACQEELRAAGGRPRRTALSGPDSLTGSELRIAELAAGGLKNREIADELVLSVKTVEMHLRATYRKLAIDSRSELAAALDPKVQGGSP